MRIVSYSFRFSRIVFRFSSNHVDSFEFFRILLNSLRFYKILSNSFVFFRSVTDPVEFFQICSELGKILPYLLVVFRILFAFFGILSDSLEFIRNFADSTGFFQILSNSLEFLWILKDCFRIPSDSVEFSPIILDSPGLFSDSICFSRNHVDSFGFFRILINSLQLLGFFPMWDNSFRFFLVFSEIGQILSNILVVFHILLSFFRIRSDSRELFAYLNSLGASDSIGFFPVLLYSSGFSRIIFELCQLLLYSFKFSRSIFRFQQVLEESRGFFRIVPDSLKLFPILSISLESFWLPWNCFHILSNFSVFFQRLYDSVGFFRIVSKVAQILSLFS